MVRPSRVAAGLWAVASASASLVSDDSVAFVQSSAWAGQRANTRAMASSVAGRYLQSTMADTAAADSAGVSPAFNCTKYPQLCQAPFNCQTFNKEVEVKTWTERGYAPEGHANLRTWCASPQYANYMEACIVKKDLFAAAQIQFDWSIQNGDGVDEMDGSYCFIEGHCTNTAVTNETTVEEADKMCDERYGREQWSSLPKKDSLPAYVPLLFMTPGLADHKTGFHDTRMTSVFLKMACAMGNYHCDVAYCRETYCKKEYYVKKYGHLLPKAPGHLLQDRTRL